MYGTEQHWFILNNSNKSWIYKKKTIPVKKLKMQCLNKYWFAYVTNFSLALSSFFVLFFVVVKLINYRRIKKSNDEKTIYSIFLYILLNDFIIGIYWFVYHGFWYFIFFRFLIASRFGLNINYSLLKNNNNIIIIW